MTSPSIASGIMPSSMHIDSLRLLCIASFIFVVAIQEMYVIFECAKFRLRYANLANA